MGGAFFALVGRPADRRASFQCDNYLHWMCVARSVLRVMKAILGVYSELLMGKTCDASQ